MMSKRIDGWAIWSKSGGIYSRLDQEGWECLCIYPADVYEKNDLEGAKGVSKLSHQTLIPIRIIPANTWDKLMEWCGMMANAHRRSLETLNCDDALSEISEEVEADKK